MNRLPSWFKQGVPEEYSIKEISALNKSNIKTVCSEAKCPNFITCLRKKKLTFIILGDTCTRNCSYCAVKKSGTKKRLNFDFNEPVRVAEVVRSLGIRYAVVTSVARDDLEDGGAGEFVKTVKLIRAIDKDIKVELLIPDFQGKIKSLIRVIDSCPDVIGHNIETVARLYKTLRPEADYGLSLNLIAKIKDLSPELLTKSSIMLGLGESEREVINTMEELSNIRCDILTLGQYLAPSNKHYPVKEFISLGQFQKYKNIAIGLGFKFVLSGPLVRSSYQAEEVYKEVVYA
jgi:lipoic acid synthetase